MQKLRQRKERYLTSLENIVENDTGNRHEKAQELYARYKQESSRLFLVKNIDRELVACQGSPRFLTFKSPR